MEGGNFLTQQPVGTRAATLRRYGGMGLVLLMHGAGVWLFAVSMNRAPAAPAEQEIQAIVVSVPKQMSRSIVPAFQATFRSPENDDPPPPDIQIADDEPAPATASNFSGMVVPPRPDPTYPNPNPPLAAALLKDRVALEMTILVGADGRVTACRIAESSGQQRIDQAAIEFVKANWRFRPAQQNGTAVADWTSVSVTLMPA